MNLQKIRAHTIVGGFFTGLFLQLAIGPVFIYILNLSLEFGFKNGISAVLGAVVADYLYILLAVFGTGKLLEVDKIKLLFTVISSVVLIVFGIGLMKKGILFDSIEQIQIHKMSLLQCFGSTFILTISSPLTIVFWTGIFTAKAVEYSLNQKELFLFGLAAGSATIVFLGFSVILLSFLKIVFPVILIKYLNLLVGLILIVFGAARIMKLLSSDKIRNNRP